ncbi:hypothetical protein R50072_36760 [Simiduia litorea]
MQRDNLEKELRVLIGKTVDRKGNACNSLNIHFGDVSFWIDPSWRYEANGKIIIASGDFAAHDSYESKEEYETDFHRCCAVTDPIKGAQLTAVEITPQNDLVMEFSGGQVIRTFHTFIEDNEENWYVSFFDKSIRYLALANEITAEKITRNKSKQQGPSAGTH